MSSPSTLELLKSIDPLKNAEEFYHTMVRKMVLMSTPERKEIVEWAAKANHVSEFNAAAQTFAASMLSIYASDFKNAVASLEIANGIFKKLDNKGGQLACETIYCTTFRSMGQMDKAQAHVQAALQLLPHVNSNEIYGYFKAVAFYQAAEISIELKNFDSAQEYYNEGLKFTGENDELQGRLLNGLGILYMNLERWDDAITHLLQSLKVIEGQNNTVLESKILSDIGLYYFKTKDYLRSAENQENSLRMRLQSGMQSPAITNYIRLAELCLATGDLEMGSQYGRLAAEYAEKLKVNIKLYEAHQVLAAIYEKEGNIKKAYEHFRRFHQHKEEVHSQDVMRKVEQLKNQYKVESANQEKEIFRLKNVELKAALNEIEQSFRYAKRIQTAILPPEKFVNEILNDSFVLFKPKDIVSGDFYWMEIVDRKILIAAADCTGHGVPGAMVSMVGNNCLNKAVHEFGLEKPSDILNKLTELVEGTFVHKDVQYTEEEIKDGMDISLCCIDPHNKQIEWAGANNPFWLLREGKMQEITADKQPIGKFDDRTPFTNHVIPFLEGDCLYLFTDGYADQFGGPAGKKFKYRQLQELLLSINSRPMQEQKRILDERFESWRGVLEQIDDVCIIGVRL
ncbi:MAG: SpoIIE family protein phosphatase [Bacteroidia bacterium]